MRSAGRKGQAGRYGQNAGADGKGQAGRYEQYAGADGKELA